MTDHQAKKLSVTSVRRGRKRVKSLVCRVVSYFTELYLREMRYTAKRALIADVHKALREPDHPARRHTKIDLYMSKNLTVEMIEDAIAAGVLEVKI